MGGHYIININNECNSYCSFCADSEEKRSRKNKSYQTLIAELEDARRKFSSLIISGGEPTIYSHILDYIKHAKDVCKYDRISITSNGFLFYYEDFVDKLIENGVNDFVISFQIQDAKIYDAICKVRNSFHYVDMGIRNLRERNQTVRANTVIHKLNYKHLDKIVEYLIESGIVSIQLAFMNPIGVSVINGKSVMAISYTETMPIVKKAFKIADKFGFGNLFIENFPICIAEPYMNNMSDLNQPKENKDYYNATKSKPGICFDCQYYDKCNGAWIAYLNQFGNSELKPRVKRIESKVT